MNSENWQQVKDLYEAALELPTGERERFINEASKDDEEVRREALAMLRVALSGRDFLDSVRINGVPSTVLASSGAFPGQIISGRFRIEERIGHGGMGEVYRATDLELNRRVALKTIRSSSSITEELRARLRQEAQLISKLNHPAICTLYDVRQDTGVEYLVMEFLEGETLAHRLSRGSLTLRQSVEIALDILGALDYAHRQGVIHRDIKPGNIMLTNSGAKLLDFGIAKLRYCDKTVERSHAGGPLTPLGIVPGTPPYMAPEQVRDGVADVRSDIYSFGVLFYRSLSGRPESPATTSIDLGKIQQPFQQIIAKCLGENPAERWQDAGDLRTALELASQQPLEQSSNESSTRPLKVIATATASIATICLLLVMFLWNSSSSTAQLEFQVFPPVGAQFLPIEQSGSPEISPDGTALTFVAREQQGPEKLWLRRIGSSSAVPLTGTEEASHPFWSPDSRTIAFFAHNRLMAIDIGGNTPRLICEAREGRGGTWGRDGIIVFSPGYTDPLFRVPASGGVPVPITALNTALQENSHRWPSFLPDGKHVLFVVRAITREHSGLYAVSIQGSDATRIDGIDTSARYVSQNRQGSGYLLYVRGSQVVAQPFAPDKLRLAGEPIAVAELGFTDTSTTRSPVSVSETGVLMYGGGRLASSQFVWYDAKGKELSRLNNSGVTRFLRLSPDGRTVAVERLDFRFGSGSLWLLQSDLGTATRFTFEPMSAYSPVWSPDAKNIAFTVHKGTEFDLMWASTDGTSSRVLLTSPQSEPVVPTDWTTNGLILYEIRNPNTGWDLYAVSAMQPSTKRILLNSPANEREARVSPHDDWLTYTSNEDGREEVYVQPFPASGQRFRISPSGGSQPIWSRHSTDIFFIDRNRTLVRSHINLPLKQAGTPIPLFRLPPVTQPGMISAWEYDVTADDNRFLTGLSASLQESKPITVVHGWKLPNQTQ